MGGEAAFNAFYREQHPRVWAFLRRVTGDAALAEDVAQESFIRMLGSRAMDLPAAERRSYVFRIANNLISDGRRRKSREPPMASLDELTGLAAEGAPDAPGEDARRALEGLGERDRKLLWLAHVEQYDHREIAGILGLAQGSVRVLLFRARERMKQMLERSRSP